MEKKSAKNKQLRRKSKRAAAAFAVAAIMAGAALPGIPMAQASAAEAPPVTVKHVKSDKAEKSKPPGRGWHEHKHGWPSSDENQGWYEDGRIYYRSDNYNHHTNWRLAHQYFNPISFVKDAGYKYGFDRYRDSFTLVSQSRDSATVMVEKNLTGEKYIVDLDRDYYNDWSVEDVKRIK
ncbi:hypothetical protein [Dendrosporobacter sp. 1207_IL3150]|uniref:hypothetical protein n=1 Tax=Dendrosporobacter sp. 1207_IL3150 TaxID=3084054 RepID=UPI002FDA5534